MPRLDIIDSRHTSAESHDEDHSEFTFQEDDMYGKLIDKKDS